MQSSSASLASKTLDFIDSKTLIKPDRTGATPWLQKHLAKPTPDGAWRWERLPGEDDDWQLLDRGGRMVARVRQEGDGYWVARPRITPKPPIESFEAACRRAVETATLTLAWPESERHAIHPGMTASQFEATCRDLTRKYPDWSAKEIRDHITGILKPSIRQDCLIKYDCAPVNIIGGYRFPGAPVVDLSPIEPTSKLSPAQDRRRGEGRIIQLKDRRTTA
jgi:hypothetical protein